MESQLHNLDRYKEDFQELYWTRQFLYNYLFDISTGKNEDQELNISSSIFHKKEIVSKDGKRKVRIVLPHGFNVLGRYLDSKDVSISVEEKKTWFVGFFGTPKDMVEENIISEVWKYDSRLCDALKTQENIVAYLTVQVSDGEDNHYYNMVLLSSDSAVDKWKEVNDHTKAVSLSSNYYDQVRIHMGEFDDGLCGDTFTVIRTTFIRYKCDSGSGNQIDKHIQLWHKNENVVKINL